LIEDSKGLAPTLTGLGQSPEKDHQQTATYAVETPLDEYELLGALLK